MTYQQPPGQPGSTPDEVDPITKHTPDRLIKLSEKWLWGIGAAFYITGNWIIPSPIRYVWGALTNVSVCVLFAGMWLRSKKHKASAGVGAGLFALLTLISVAYGLHYLQQNQTVSVQQACSTFNADDSAFQSGSISLGQYQSDMGSLHVAGIPQLQQAFSGLASHPSNNDEGLAEGYCSQFG